MTKPRHIPDKLTRDSELVICPCCCFFLVSSCSLYNHKMNLFSFSRDWQVKTSCSSGRTGGWLLLLHRVEFDLQNKALKKFLFTCFSPVRLVFRLPLKPFLWPNCSLGHVLENSAKCSGKKEKRQFTTTITSTTSNNGEMSVSSTKCDRNFRM